MKSIDWLVWPREELHRTLSGSSGLGQSFESLVCMTEELNWTREPYCDKPKASSSRRR